MRRHEILHSESGQAVGIIMILMTVVAGTTAILLSNGKLAERLSFHKTSQQIQQRADIAQVLANFTLYSAALSQSVFDQGCLQSQVEGQKSPLHLGERCLLHAVNQSNLDTASPQTDDHTYYPFSLKSPFNNSINIAGTRANPACYGRDGALCTDASCECIYKAYAMYKQGSVPVLGMNGGIPAGGFGATEPSIIVKVKIATTALANKVGPSQENSANAKLWSAETQMRLSEINSRGNSTEFAVCVENGAIKPGYVKVGAKTSSTNTGNGAAYEADVCVPAVGAKPCAKDQFQVGITALGEPVCSGSRSPCGANQIPVGMQDTGSNNVQIKCMNAECRNRSSNVFAGGRAFGFVSPKSSDATEVSCVLVEPSLACINNVKNSLGGNGSLLCNSQPYTDGTPSNSLCSNLATCAPVQPRPPIVDSTDPIVEITWSPSATPCAGLCPPPPGLPDFRPAFASRAMGCISCHAVVSADVITDYGYGDPWFWGQRGQGFDSMYPHDPVNYHNNMYSDYIALSWPTGSTGVLNSMKITTGNLVIPRNVSLPVPPGNKNTEYLAYAFPTTFPIPTPPPTLRTYIESFGKETNCKAQKPGGAPGEYICEFTGLAPSFGVREVNSIYIGAPSAAEIMAVGLRLDSHPPFRWTAIQTFVGAAVGASISSSSVSGIVQSSPGKFRAENGDVRCDHDVYIDGDLFLRDINLRTKYGCKLYVTGHVIINGTLNVWSYSTNTATSYENLQITSAKSINLGLGSLSSCAGALPQSEIDVVNSVYPPLANQIQTNPGYHLVLKRYAWWDAESRGVNGGIANRTAFATEVMNAMKHFSAQDAVCTDRNVSLKRVLFNAPYIMNRYTGAVEGSMIGEVIMNGLANFPFSYHDVFRRVPVLPLLNYTQFLSIDGSNGSSPRGNAVTPGNY